MDDFKHGISGIKIPSYVEEILTHNYCPYFMRMSIIREDSQYKFIYRPENYRRIDIKSLDSYSRLILLREIMSICEKTSNYLIKADSFLLEPELVYIRGETIRSDRIRIMYYPDVKQMDTSHKIMQFAERIKGSSREEREVFDQFRRTIETGDVNRSLILLEKNIIRLEGRMMNKAV